MHNAKKKNSLALYCMEPFLTLHFSSKLGAQSFFNHTCTIKILNLIMITFYVSYATVTKGHLADDSRYLLR